MCSECVRAHLTSCLLSMLRYSKDGITIATVLDIRSPHQDGTLPVRVRVNYNRTRQYYPTGKSLTPHDWEVLPTTKNKELSNIRKDIENSFELVKSAVVYLADRGDFSFVRLKAHLSHGSSTMLRGIFCRVIEELRAEGKHRTASIYEQTMKSVARYGGEVPIGDITPRWLARFSAYLADEGKAQTTIAITLRTLRAVLNRAKREGIMKEADYPFGKGRFEIQEGEGRKLALTLEQIGEIARYDDGTELTRRYRDYWLFLYLCNGINVADFAQLRYRDIVDGEVRFVRQKTASTSRRRKEIVAVVSEPMRTIIDRWGLPNKDGYIFPILPARCSGEDKIRYIKNATRAINQRMDKVGEALGLGKITTYTARHSFATVLKRAGANIAYISESLGHSDLRTTEHYLASFEREEREKNAALLTKY